jgi:hypothetical protein
MARHARPTQDLCNHQTTRVAMTTTPRQRIKNSIRFNGLPSIVSMGTLIPNARPKKGVYRKIPTKMKFNPKVEIARKSSLSRRLTTPNPSPTIVTINTAIGAETQQDRPNFVIKKVVE